MVLDCNHAQHQNCINTAIDNAKMICQEKGIRFTYLRKRVLELIWENHTPQKAYDLLKKLQQEDMDAKPATVYRTLDFLMEYGFIHRINSLNSYIGCVNTTKKGPYFLLVCLNCHVVEESINQHYSELFNKIVNDNQFQCMNRTFEIEGKCQKCSN